MHFKKLIVSLLPLLIFCLTAKGWAQYDIPEVPEKQVAVYDYTDLLPASEETLLRTKLQRYADSTSTQIVVLIIESTKGEDISFLGAKWGQKWGIGQAKEDNGVLVTLAVNDRKVDINTGYGVETVMTDRMAEQIINRIMIPQFKENNYYAGLDQGTDAIISALAGTYKENRKKTSSGSGFKTFPVFLLIVIIIIILSRIRGGGGRGGRGRRSGSLLDVLVLSSLGRGSWGGSSGGGFGGGSGGFGGGFGGGGFGGGGASGGW